VIHSDGTTEWWRSDQHHREDGPAVIWSDGHLAWYRDGARTRIK
jgi:hypothetical protein